MRSLLGLFMPALFVSALFYPHQANSETKSSFQPLAQSSLLVDITLVNDRLISVGERGHILRWQDNQWQQIESPVNTLLTKIFFVDDNHGWAVGHDASIIATKDGGKSWHKQLYLPSLESPFFDVIFFNLTDGIAVGAYGLFYRTQDGGQTWHQQFHDELLSKEDKTYLDELKQSDNDIYLIERQYVLPHFNRLALLSDGRLLLIGEQGLLAVSTDKGQNFTSLKAPYQGSFFNVIETDKSLYLMGMRGSIYQSSMLLDDWKYLSTGTVANINDAVLDNNGKLWFVGNAGVILTINSDVLAQYQYQTGQGLLAIEKDPLGKLWLVGVGGVWQLTPEKIKLVSP